MKDQTDLESRARELYPASPHLQAHWLKAVARLRTSAYGWRFDVPQQHGKSQILADTISAAKDSGRQVIMWRPKEGTLNG
jgi:hypothetical protein